jgi:endonuclease YncB( thermonuclease family)
MNTSAVDIIKIVSDILIPGLLAIIAVITYFSSRSQETRQLELAAQQEKFEKNIRLQQQYIEYLSDDSETKKNAAILMLRLMDKETIVQLANTANDLSLSQDQRLQIIKILGEKAGTYGSPFTVFSVKYEKISDGDTFKFSVLNQSNWLNLERGPRLSRESLVSIRLAGIDALEIYPVPIRYGGNHLKFGKKAKLALERELYLSQDNSGKIIPSEGYVAVSTSDNYGRPIGFAFNKRANFQDGSVVYLTTNIVKESVNYKLLLEGAVYPYFVSLGLPEHATSVLRQAAQDARKKKCGVWQYHSDKLDLSDDEIYNSVTYPRLLKSIGAYRRKEELFSNLKVYLTSNSKLIKNLKDDKVSFFHENLQISENIIRLNIDPEDIYFLN